MNDATLFVVCILLPLVLIIFAYYFSKPLKATWVQKRTDDKRERAHAGKVKCEETEEKCDKIATFLTHNGYFCHDHWEQNSKYEVNGGFVTWHHILYHAIRRS